VNPLGCGTGRLGRAGRVRGESGWAAPNSFSFSNLFCKLQINLNFNDLYSHNKIQEHFITPRKICNDMNATNNYLL
jgi:hypothetical protein